MGSRFAALGLFVLGQMALAALSLGIALVPALVTFALGSVLLVSDTSAELASETSGRWELYSTCRGERTTARNVSRSTLKSSQRDQFSM